MRKSLPKPLHGWRVFAGEVGVIVLGVLIALIAQQLVATWNDRQRAKAAVDALRTELAGHDDNFISFERTAPCVNAQIDLIERRLVDGQTTPLQLYHRSNFSGVYVLVIPTTVFPDSAWRTIESTDLMPLLDPKLVSFASDYYGRFANLRQFNLDIVSQSAALNALAVMMPTDTQGRLHFIERLEQLREDMGRFDLAARQMRNSLKQIGMLPTRNLAELNKGSGSGFCRSHGFPVGQAVPATGA